MISLRQHLMRHRALTVCLVALALLMKVAIPSGYMMGSSGGAITIELCSGYGPQKMVTAMPGMEHHPDKQGDHGKPEMPCAFSGLTAAVLTGADPVLLAGAVDFIISTAFRIAVDPAPAAAWPYLRPPLRGPPLSR